MLLPAFLSITPGLLASITPGLLASITPGLLASSVNVQFHSLVVSNIAGNDGVQEPLVGLR